MSAETQARSIPLSPRRAGAGGSGGFCSFFLFVRVREVVPPSPNAMPMLCPHAPRCTAGVPGPAAVVAPESAGRRCGDLRGWAQVAFWGPVVQTAPPPRLAQCGPAVGGGSQSGWGRLLSVTNAIEAGSWRQGDSGWALAGRPGGGLLYFQCIPGWGVAPQGGPKAAVGEGSPHRRDGGVRLAPGHRRGTWPSSVRTRHRASETGTVRGLRWGNRPTGKGKGSGEGRTGQSG